MRQFGWLAEIIHNTANPLQHSLWDFPDFRYPMGDYTCTYTSYICRNPMGGQ